MIYEETPQLKAFVISKGIQLESVFYHVPIDPSPPSWGDLFPAVALFVLWSILVCNLLSFPSSSIKKNTKSSPCPFLTSDQNRNGPVVKGEPGSNLTGRPRGSVWRRDLKFPLQTFHFYFGVDNVGVELYSVRLTYTVVWCISCPSFPVSVRILPHNKRPTTGGSMTAANVLKYWWFLFSRPLTCLSSIASQLYR